MPVWKTRWYLPGNRAAKTCTRQSRSVGKTFGRWKKEKRVTENGIRRNERIAQDGTGGTEVFYINNDQAYYFICPKTAIFHHHLVKKNLIGGMWQKNWHENKKMSPEKYLLY